MNLLDMIIIAAMIFLIVRGIFRGFFKEIASLAGVILGIWLGYQYQPEMTEYLKTYLPYGIFLPIISFAVIFTIVLILCNLAGWGIKKMMEKVLLGWADKTMGAGLAILKGIIIIYFALVLLSVYIPSKAPLIARSRLAPIIITSYQSLSGLISPGAYQKWKKRFLGDRKLKEEAEPDKSQTPSQKDGSQQII